MSIYLRGEVWYYLFYINGRRYRGSTKTNNETEALRVEARKRVAAEQGESLRPKRVPLVREFVKPFEEWLDKTTLAANTKSDYKNGRRLILKTPLAGMRMDLITADDVETMNFHESPHSRNCAIRTLRRMLGKARDWKLVREVPRIKTAKVYPRDRMISLEDEKRLLGAAKRPARSGAHHHVGFGNEKRGGHENAMGKCRLGWRILFQPQGQDAQGSAACAVERARHRSAQDDSASAVARAVCVTRVSAPRRMGLSLKEISIRPH